MSRVPFSVVIPARYASSRLPGKALADIAGTPMHATAVGLILHACHHMGDLESVSRGGRRVGRAFGRMRQMLQELF